MATTSSVLLGKFATLQQRKPIRQIKKISNKSIIKKVPFLLPVDKARGIKAEKLDIEQVETASEKLIDITMGAHETLVTATSVFPFVLFPDTINVDRQKVTLIRRSFFRTAEVVSVQINDIINVDANVGPLYGSLKLTSKYFLDLTHSINFLRRKDVTRVQRLLQGFIIANREEIDCSTIEKQQLITLLIDLGQGSTD